ncbi:MAG TPA: DUF3267 domain-containing protein [Candidatus Limnocylindrales bacterium]|nr:DUF3267 domain-containing protein [Candidatus Limnocylindrales bacterium]
MAAIRRLPEGWHEASRTVLTDEKLLLRLSALALIPLVVSGAAMLIVALLVLSSHPQHATGPDVPWWASLLLALLVLPLHELVHAAAILLVGHRPRLGIKLDKGVLYATADQALFTRNQYLAVALSPLVVLSLAGACTLLVLPTGWWWTAGLAVMLNASGAIGDLWASAQVRVLPRSALVRDTEDGFIIYLRQPTS